MKRAAVLIFLMCATKIAAAQDSGSPMQRVPLPRPRPPFANLQQAPAPPQPSSMPPQPSSAAVPTPPSDCDVRLAKIATFEPRPDLVGPGGCGAADAVLLRTIVLPNATKVAVNPPATLRCTMAEQVALWLREDVEPAAIALGAALRRLDNLDSYECRGRNRVPGAKLSEHGRANALDVQGFKLADGRTIALTDVNVDKDWRERIRASACARFSTVLGPGSDGYHEQHIHLDLEARRNNYKICEWDVREPVIHAAAPLALTDGAMQPAAQMVPRDTVPLPRPRPAAADASTRGLRLRHYDRN